MDDMNRVDDEWDSLLVRSVHGELDAEERLALDRRLLRDPEARRTHEAFADLDHAATAGLRTVLDPQRSAARHGPWSASIAPRRRWGWAQVERWFVPFAAAAALLIALIPASPRRGAGLASAPFARQDADIRSPLERSGSPIATPVSTSPTNIKRQTSRDVVGLIDKEGKIWVLELDRTRTLRTPGSEGESPTRPGGW